MALHDRISVRGAREHNLKNIDIDIPRDKLVVLTGLSGSGKSSLAFDTIFAEGQRRYVESLSAYARQFLGQMEKPDVDHIDGLSPAISIDQKGSSRNPRSTVGTVTEIYDYMRLLFARIGHPHCPQCGRPIVAQSVQQMARQLLELPSDTRLMILAPVIRDRKGEHQGILDEIRRQGFVRVRVDGTVLDIDEAAELDLEKYRKHSIEVVVDRLVIRHDEGVTPEDHPDRVRIIESLETALKIANGIAEAQIVDGEAIVFSEKFSCPVHGVVGLTEIEPRNFSFNSPHGACPVCTGLGTTQEFDPDLIMPNRGLSLAQGAVAPWLRVTGEGSAWYTALLEGVAAKYGFSLDVPIRDLPHDAIDVLLNGSRGKMVTVRYISRSGRMRSYDVAYEGVIPNLQRRYQATSSDYVREELERYMAERPCPTCHGARLKPEVLGVTVGGRSIVDVARLPIRDARDWFAVLARDPAEDPTAPLTDREFLIARQIFKEIRERLGFLVDVGLDYLTLERSANTLSGGEAQRIRLATQIGSSLMGVLYILDEPSIGLHQRDNARLIATLERLRELGNTLLVVEHDEDTIRHADWVIDIGPAAGEHGGRLIHSGPLPELMENHRSVTAAYLRGDKAVTGVSGSGKSSLVTQILHPALAQRIWGSREPAGNHERIEGIELIDKVIEIDQSPIGRTPRSNPATYTGLWGPLRELLAAVPESRLRGYKPGRFSFNVKGGRCEACEGAGIVQIEMHFLPDVYVPCEVCKGQRYNRETLEIHYKGKNVAEILEMTVEEALRFFEAVPSIRGKLQTLHDVGMGYIHLGQPATTLSGGEAQRVKLATELSKRATGKTFYILDEPTTGLHFDDVARLLNVLSRLVDAGNTVVVIEHNLDVIKTADWVIDLGPGGGVNGGEILVEGTPEAVAASAGSFTGE